MRIFVFLLSTLVLVAQPVVAPVPDRVAALEARVDRLTQAYNEQMNYVVAQYNELVKAHNDLVDTVTAMLDQGEPAQPRPSTFPIRYEKNFR